MRRFALLLLTLALGWASALSYTVQVVAVSDQAAALDVQRRLLDDSFPAYVVRASTVQGDIYRVRVGAFANRDAAVRFAAAMPVVAGGPPLPALAEGIPAAVMPLQPRLLLEFPGGDHEVIAWREGVALRYQPDRFTPATYTVPQDGEALEFEAWNAGPAEGGVVRLRNLPLWPADWEQLSGDERTRFQEARLDAVAEQLGVDSGELELLQRRPVFGPPFLVVLEQFDPSIGPVPAAGSELAPGTRILGVAGAQEVLSGYGPSDLEIGAEPPERELLYRASPLSRPAQPALVVGSWALSADGPFFTMRSESGGSAWRAGVGEPLWSDGSFLISRLEGELLLYDFVPRD